MNRRITGALAAAFAALAIAPGAVQAASFCVVPAAGCDVDNDPNAFTTLGSAVEASNNNGSGETDTIRLGAASYTPETAIERYELNTPVDILGAGTGKTIINSGSQGFFTLALFAPNSHIADATIRMGGAGQTEYGIALLGANTVAERLEVIANNDVTGGDEEGAVLLQGGPIIFKNSSVRAPTGPGRNTWGIEALFNPAGTKVENVSVVADKGLITYGTSEVVAKNVDITANRGIMTFAGAAGNGNITVDTGIVRGIPGEATDPMGIYVPANGGSQSPVVTAKNLTLVGNGGGVGVNVEELTCGGPPTGSPKAILHNTLSTGYPIAGRTKGCNTACPGAASAVLENHFSAFNTPIANIDGGCAPTEAGIFTSNLGLVSASDPRPRFPSPLIDAGNPAAAVPADPTLDLAGLGRFVDGNADGTPRRDVGAYEYQRRAPTVTASTSPGSGTPGTVFAFNATASDPDGDAIDSFSWAFSDSGTATGNAASHAFSALGVHTGTVTVKDSAGLSGSSSASVEVVPAPTPTPTPTVTPKPPDTTGPNVLVKGGSLKVDKKRKAKVTITCPASEPAPCQIAIDAKSAKKIAFKKGKRKKVQALGKGSGSVPAGKSATVTLTLSKAAFSYLKKKKKLAATLSVTAKDAAGNPTKSSAKVTLKAPKK
jgi:hypothetical protein